MPTASEVFKSKWQRAVDLKAPVLRTIDRVEMRTIGRGNDVATKPVIFFTEPGAQPLICNAGNWKSISAIAGQDDSDLWPGTRIVLFPTMVEFGGEQVAGIRVRAPKSNPSAAPAKPAPPPAPVTAPAEDDIPF